MTALQSLQAVIGLEVHAQLRTASKMFCGCSAAYAGARPNSHVCAVCGGMPGALPVINRKAVELTVLTGLALGCHVASWSKFDRKNYSYPDLPKGYQISQYDLPLCTGGMLSFHVKDQQETCGIVRVHLEEDTGKSVHTALDGRDVSLIDYNRSGVPLLEIVGAPELTSPESAREYFASLRRLLMYLRVCDGNLQEGSMRADVNVSVCSSTGELGTKVEIKNLNSFRAVQKALEFEIHRQRQVVLEGGMVTQETRGWSERDEVTNPQRTKEFAHDYRYFPEPDLPPLVLTDLWTEKVREMMPELPPARLSRFVQDLKLPPAVARTLAEDPDLGDFFDAALRADLALSPVVMANWLVGEVNRMLREANVTIGDSRLSPILLAELVRMVEDGVVSGSAGKAVLEEVFHTGESAETVVDRLSLRQVGDENELDILVDQVISANDTIVQQYRGGKTNAIQALAGKAMAASEGRANPRTVMQILRRKLNV